MVNSVFVKALWDRRVSMIWWIIGVLLMSAFLIGFYPALRDSPDVQEFIDGFPPELASLFGINPATYTTGFGYLQAQLYSFIAPIIVIAFTVSMGAAATAGEEEAGTMDLLLANPIGRPRIVIEQFLATVVLTTVIVLTFVVSLLIGDPAVDLRLSIEGIFGINLGLLLLGLLFGALAMAVGAWRGRRTVAAGVAGGAAIVAWFIDGFAPVVEGLEGVAKFLPFHWYLADDPLLNGPPLWYLLLAAGVLVLLVLSVVAFRKRDIRTEQPLIPQLVTGEDRTGEPAKPGLFDGLLGTIYGKSLWDRRRSVWWWLLGLGALAALTIAFWPTVAEGQDQFQGLLEAVPNELLAIFGISDPAALLTPGGFLSARLYSSVGTIILLVFAINYGTSALAGEERRGTMDLLLANPVERRSAVLQKLAAMVTLVAFLAFGLFVVVVAGSAAVDMDLAVGNIAAANAGLALLALLFGALALAVGAFTGRPTSAGGIPAAVAVGAFLLNGLGAAIDILSPFRPLSPFYWYLRDSPPLDRGFSSTYWIMVLLAVLFSAAAVYGFQHRQIGT